MKTNSKIVLLVAGVAMSATAAVSAYAQSGAQTPSAPANAQDCNMPGGCEAGERGMGPRGEGQRGKWGRQMASNEHGRRGPQGFGQRGGRGQAPQMMFQRADADNSGSITLEEFTTMSPLDLAAADADANGSVNVDELTDAMLRQMVQRRAERMIERLDTDGDGEVSTAEIESRQQEMFARLDIDGSGAIEQDELRVRRGGGDRGERGERGEFRRHHGGGFGRN